MNKAQKHLQRAVHYIAEQKKLNFGGNEPSNKRSREQHAADAAERMSKEPKIKSDEIVTLRVGIEPGKMNPKLHLQVTVHLRGHHEQRDMINAIITKIEVKDSFQSGFHALPVDTASVQTWLTENNVSLRDTESYIDKYEDMLEKLTSEVKDNNAKILDWVGIPVNLVLNRKSSGVTIHSNFQQFHAYQLPLNSNKLYRYAEFYPVNTNWEQMREAARGANHDTYEEAVIPQVNERQRRAADAAQRLREQTAASAQSAPSSRRQMVLVNSQKYETTGVFVHPQDVIFKHLKISREFSDYVRDTGRIFLVFAGVPAGYIVEGTKQTWHAVEYSFKDDLLEVIQRPMHNLYAEEVVTKRRPHKEFFLSPGDDGFWDGTAAEDLTTRVEENLPKLINKKRRTIH